MDDERDPAPRDLPFNGRKRKVYDEHDSADGIGIESQLSPTLPRRLKPPKVAVLAQAKDRPVT